MRLRISNSITFSLCSLFASLLVAQDAVPAAVVAPAKINVYPADIQLTTIRDRQALIVQAEYA
ncbi:MAG: hypothetical protein ABI614_09670, partial [Planctomycetota bacterium]